LNWWWPADYPKTATGRPGAAEVLREDAALEEALLSTGRDNLKLLPAGKLPNNQRPSFAHSEELATLLAALDEKFDHIILDLPAVTATSESISLAAYGSAVCLIIHQGVTPVQRVRAVLDDLDHLNIIGVIMNQVNIAAPSFLLDYLVQE
jgi:Mrp family chromosome partitioning ATPase